MKVRPDGELKNPRVIILGESPGKEEKREGRPFVGPSGERLARYLGVPHCSKERKDRRILVTNLGGMSPPWKRTLIKLAGRSRMVLVFGEIAWEKFQRFHWKHRALLGTWRAIPCTHPSPKNKLSRGLLKEWRVARKAVGGIGRGACGLMIVCGILAPMLSGCTTILYARGESNDDQSYNSYIEKIPMRSQQPYLVANKVISRAFYTNLGNFLFLELTPLGIMGPLFGYPEKKTSYEGVLLVKSKFPVAAKLEYPLRSTKPSQDISRVVDFNDDLPNALAATGRGVRYTPESVTINFRCSKNDCSVSVSPPIIQSDGSISLSSQTVVDPVRLKALEDAEALRLKAIEDEERRRQKEERKRKKEVCDALKGPKIREYEKKFGSVNPIKNWTVDGKRAFEQMIMLQYVNAYDQYLLSRVRVESEKLILYAGQFFNPAVNLANIAETAETFFTMNGCSGEVEVRYDLSYAGQGERTVLMAYVDMETGRGRVTDGSGRSD